MKHDAMLLVISIYRANRSKEKTHHLEEFLDNFEILKLESYVKPNIEIFAILA
jgi:hypothetical protein